MCEHIIFSDSTGLYFYSAWLQANAAMFAIVFIFAVYKSQSLQNNISYINNLIVSSSPMYIDGEIMRMYFNPKTRQEAIDSVEDEYWKNKLIVMRHSLDEVENIQTWVKPLFILLPISLIFNGLLITLSSHLHKLGYYFEAIPILVLLIFQMYLVIKLTIVTKKIFYRKSEI